MDQITVTGDLASDALAEAGRTVDVNTLSFDIFLGMHDVYMP